MPHHRRPGINLSTGHMLMHPAAARVDDAARRSLLRWFEANKRDLPWRRTRDPYAVWVSEAMLQQTRVDVVVPYFERWMKRFPTVASLAKAREDDVLAAWSGLGYYSRARNLRAAAKHVHLSGAAIPTTATGLAELPGVGPYTASAVASIAFGEPVACVDGNVLRVVARVARLPGASTDPKHRRRVQDLAQEWLDARRPGDWNQAMMELGATVCTPRSPNCGACPLQRVCVARAHGVQGKIPAPRRRPSARRERMEFAAVVSSGRVLMVRNQPGLLGGMLGLPGGRRGAPLAKLVEEQTGVRPRLSRAAARAEFAFTHRTWDLSVRRGEVSGEHPRTLRVGARWVPLGRLDDEAVPAATRVALHAAGLLA